MTPDGLLTTPLHERQQALGARFVAFAGYSLPVQYAAGIIAEHRHTREAAGLFDISHMGQATLAGLDHETTARAIETLVPADILGLAPGRQRYTQLLNEQGGIIDDLMVSRAAGPSADGRLYLVVNAARKEADFRHLALNLPENVRLIPHPGRALVALQGPLSADVLARFAPALRDLPFMGAAEARIEGVEVSATRSGYTGEDGFELSVVADRAVALWDVLAGQPEVRPVGLGARDSLRLEAGLCLYGHDINEETSPVEAGLAWSIPKRRRAEGGFPGHRRILAELEEGTLRKRVGILPQGRTPAREGTAVLNGKGELIGEVTSGGFGPSVSGPIAMGYVVSDYTGIGTAIGLDVRGKVIPASVVPLPFITHGYRR
ncbi:MAG: glycine cleavage system aminomethyltransferase GcvT [Pseudochelatococcus sp.]|jgi:aminomethyltransferase|uniref:glycine cleavage system aminomethyltransferase GcvT n=1 Tax=Pseudochelatococcus sp. TaxID=2020869 RepID=UPI003D936C91